MTMIVVKARLGDDLRKFKFELVYDVATDFAALRSIVEDTFQVKGGYRIKYKDEDDDWVSLVTMADFNECMDGGVGVCHGKPLYLSIIPVHATRSLSVTTTQSSIAGSTAASDIDSLMDRMDSMAEVAATGPAALQPDHIEVPTGPSVQEQAYIHTHTHDLDSESRALQPDLVTVLSDHVDEDDATGAPEIIECTESIVHEDAETADASNVTAPVVTEATVTPTATDDTTGASEVKGVATTEPAGTTADVEKALAFVRRVHEKFNGDARAQRFIKLGADFHDRRISRDVFHEGCLGLFADEDELLDAFLETFKTEAPDVDVDASQPAPTPAESVADARQPVPVQIESVVEACQPIPAQVPVQVEAVTASATTIESAQTVTDGASGAFKDEAPGDPGEVSSVAYMVNELQYARLLVQTRLQSLFWRTTKQVRKDTGPAMAELKEFVRNDIIVAAKEETHRLIEEARRVSATLPAQDEIVDAVVQGLQDANRVTVQVTNDIANQVNKAVREVLSEEGPVQDANRVTVQVTNDIANQVNKAVREVLSEEGPASVSTTTKSPVDSSTQDGGEQEEPVDQAAPQDPNGQVQMEPLEMPSSASFSIGVEAREAAQAAEAVADSAQQSSLSLSAPVAASNVTTEEVAEEAAEEVAEEVAEEAAEEAAEEEAEVGSTTDSFVMITKEDDSDSLLSLVMPEPDVSGDATSDDADAAPFTPAVEPAPVEPPKPTYQEVMEQAEEPVATPVPTYHQRAAGVKSSRVIDHLFNLFDMGFTDFDTNLSALQLFRNDLQKTVAELLERQESS